VALTSASRVHAGTSTVPSGSFTLLTLARCCCDSCMPDSLPEFAEFRILDGARAADHVATESTGDRP